MSTQTTPSPTALESLDFEPPCQAAHRGNLHPATHWILLGCGHDALLCAERIEHAISVMSAGPGLCPVCDSRTTIARIEPLP